MQCVFGPRAVFPTPHALTVGNFDGVHRGHQAVIAQALASAHARQLPLTVLLFEPQPREYFAKQRGEHPPARLMSVREKAEALCHAGVDRLWCLNFRTVQPMAASEFVSQLIVGKEVSHFIVGDDFRFGADRLGDYSYLQAVASEGRFSLEQCATHSAEGARISSSRVRALLGAHDFSAAEALLGRPFSFSGRVIYGQQLGRTLGFPTANIRLTGMPPITGVFACEVRLPNGDQCGGVANIGTRPTVAGQRHGLEVHLHDFDGALYGQCLTVIPRFFIRAEQRFESVHALSLQIAVDNERARALLTT